MRVLHILEATLGGTRRHVLDLAPALQRRGVTCDLFYSPLRNPHFAVEAREALGESSQLIAAPMRRGIGVSEDTHAVRLLAAHLRRHRYDVIHCHSTKAGLVGRLARSLTARHTPVVYTPHCVAFDTALPLPQRRAARWMEKLLAAQTAHFIAVSRHEAGVLRRTGVAPAGLLSVIYNGVDLETFDRLQGNEASTYGKVTAPGNGTSDPLIIGCFGRLTRQKNQRVLFEAAAHLKREGRAVRLLLVGDGEERSVLRELAGQLGIANDIAYLGEVVEPRPLYRYCDIVAQPSLWEGCPYSILEAMAARRAVVATAVGGVPELLQPNGEPWCGSLYQARRAGALTTAIADLGDEAVRCDLGDRARGCVERDFRLETMVDKTVAVYEKVGQNNR